MNLWLYKYNGENIVANKIGSLPPVYSGVITPHGNFNSRSVQFELDTLYDVNYAKYDYNGHSYYGYVDVSVNTKGIYEYVITVDPLTTAWYADCFNTWNICKYSSLGASDVADARVSKTNKTHRVFNNSIWEREGYEQYILVVQKPTPSVYQRVTNNPMFDIYVMGDGAFDRFCTNLYGQDASDQKRFGGSIVRCCVLQPDIALSTAYFTPKTNVTLYSINNTDEEPSGIFSLNINSGNGCYLFEHNEYDDRTIQSEIMWDTDKLTTFPSYDPDMDGTVEIHIPDIGIIRAPLSYLYGVSESSIAWQIKVVIDWDFISGRCRAWLSFNGYDTDLFIDSPIPIQTPIMYDSSVTDWRSINTGILISGVSAAASIIGTVATGGTLAPVAAASAISVANQVSQGLGAKFQESLGGYSTAGGTGGSVEWGGYPYLTVKAVLPINKSDVQSKYGKPDGTSRNIAFLTGWVQTESCELLSKGLPQYVIEQAQNISNSGFRIA